MMKSDDPMIVSGLLFGWIIIDLYLALSIYHAIALTLAVSNWLIFCFLK
jgi:hypothetical protein